MTPPVPVSRDDLALFLVFTVRAALDQPEAEGAAVLAQDLVRRYADHLTEGERADLAAQVLGAAGEDPGWFALAEGLQNI